MRARVGSATLRADRGEGVQALEELNGLLHEADELPDSFDSVTIILEAMTHVLRKLQRLSDALDMVNELENWFKTHPTTDDITANVLLCRSKRALLNFELGNVSVEACRADLEEVHAGVSRILGAGHPTTIQSDALLQDFALSDRLSTLSIERV